MAFDKAQFNELYQYSYALTRDEPRSFDLLHTSLEKFLRIDGVKPDKPIAYMKRIIRNQFYDDIRKYNRDVALEPEIESNIIDTTTRPLEDIMIDQQQLDHLLSRCTAYEREILYMWAVEEFTVQEISDQLAIPKGTLLSQLHRLKLKLRQFEATTKAQSKSNTGFGEGK